MILPTFSTTTSTITRHVSLALPFSEFRIIRKLFFILLKKMTQCWFIQPNLHVVLWTLSNPFKCIKRILKFNSYIVYTLMKNGLLSDKKIFIISSRSRYSSIDITVTFTTSTCGHERWLGVRVGVFKWIHFSNSTNMLLKLYACLYIWIKYVHISFIT